MARWHPGQQVVVENVMALDREFIEILACPACDDRPPLRLVAQTLVCDKCRRAYMIRDGIPILLTEESIQADDEALKQ